MLRAGHIVVAAIALWAMVGSCCAREVVDRIVAKVDTDIILLSDVQALQRYQLFVDGKSESQQQVLDRLIDQWIVRSEAKAALFSQPSESEVSRSIERLKRAFATSEVYDERKKQSGLTDADIEHMVKEQLFLSNYLDSRFRASVQIDDKDVEEFYQTRIVPRAKSRGQEPPTLDAARGYIHEALVQRAINEQADNWLKESRARVRVENLLDETPK